MISMIIKKTGLPFVMFLIALTAFFGFSGNSGAGEAKGTVAISLMDAEGDFVTYVVDVTSITLTRANGLEIETLKATTTIDFTRHVDVRKLICSTSVPLGPYTKATMVLDYSNADIRVENSVGESVNVTSIIDAGGHDVTELDVSVSLDDQNKLIVAPGLIAHLVLDFDLKSSNTVTFDDDGNAQLVVKPIVVANIDKACPKLQKVQGLRMVIK